MGFVGFLQLLLKIFHFFAWPIFALIYPLCASIQAIERNSIYNMRKLIAYWILFSLISLFDLDLSNLFDWFSLWPYIKMIAVLWFVIPQFTGAYYAYKCLVQPCLALNLKVVINWFYRNYFLAELERYVRENGTEALEELIAHKVKHGDENLAQTKKEAAEVKEFTEQESGQENRLQEEPDSTKEYTCGTYKVTSNNQAILNIHQKTLNKNSSSSTSHKSNQANWVPKKVEIKKWNCSAFEVKTQSETERKEHLQEEPEPDSTKECTCGTCKITSNGQAMLNIQKCEEVKGSNQETLNKNTTSSTLNESNQATWVPKKLEIKEWNCSVCEIETQSETALNQHLQGKKHKAKCEKIQDPTKSVLGDRQNSNETQNQEEKVGARGKSKIKTPPNYDLMKREYWCSYCNIWCVGQKGFNSHLNGRLHKARLHEWNYFYGGVGSLDYDCSVVYPY